jgi:hypothetical protein
MQRVLGGDTQSTAPHFIHSPGCQKQKNMVVLLVLAELIDRLAKSEASPEKQHAV